MKRLAIVATSCLAFSFAIGKFSSAPLRSKQIDGGTASAPASQRFQPAPSTQSIVGVDLSWDFITENPAVAADRAFAMPAGELRDEWLRVLANEWTRFDADAALQWARQNLQRDDQQRFLAVACNALAASSPFDAAKLVAELDPGEHQSDAALAVISHWFASDPDAAITWAEQFPNDLRTRAFQTIEARANPRAFAEGLPDRDSPQ